MEPFVILGIAAVVVVILAVIWQQRSHRTTSQPTGERSSPRQAVQQAPPTENEPLS